MLMYDYYCQIKEQHPDIILFIRLGDFYEAFGDDAETVAEELDLLLVFHSVAENVRVPMAGVPSYAIDGYVKRLLQAGHRVALAEKIEEDAQ